MGQNDLLNKNDVLRAIEEVSKAVYDPVKRMHVFLDYSASGKEIELPDTTENPLNAIELKGEAKLTLYGENIDIESAFSLGEYRTTPSSAAVDVINFGKSLDAGIYELTIPEFSGYTIKILENNVIVSESGKYQFTVDTTKTVTFEIRKYGEKFVSFELDDFMSVMNNAVMKSSLFPSPDYPQQIDIPGWVCKGNQLLNIRDCTNGLRAIKEDDTYIGSATIDGRSFNYENADWKLTLSAGTYTLNWNILDAGTVEGLVCGIYKANGTRIGSVTGGLLTFTLSEQTNVGVLAKTYDSRGYFMLNRGTHALPFEPFGSGVNLCKEDWRQGNATDTSQLNNRVATISNIKCKKGDKIYVKRYSDDIYFVVTEMSKDVSVASIADVTNDTGWISTKEYLYTCQTDGFIKIAVKFTNDTNIIPSNMTSRKIMVCKTEFANFPYSPYDASGGNVAKFNVVETKIAEKDIRITSENIRIGGIYNTTKDQTTRSTITLTIPSKQGETFELNCDSDYVLLDALNSNESGLLNTSVHFVEGVGWKLHKTEITASRDGYFRIQLGVNGISEFTQDNIRDLIINARIIVQTSSIPTPTGLPAIPLSDDATDYTYIDSDGKKWIADTIEYDGEKVWRTERVGIFDFTSITNIYKNSSNVNEYIYFFYKNANKIDCNENIGISNRFLVKNTATEECIRLYFGSWPNTVYITFDSKTLGGSGNNNVDYVKQWFNQNRTVLLYKRTTPITTEETDPDIISAVMSLHTNADYTHIYNEDYNDMKCNMDVEYFVDRLTKAEKRYLLTANN